MPSVKKLYKNMNKYYATQRRYKQRYRDKTGSGQHGRRRWGPEEDSMIIKHEISDREIADKIQRSVQAIQIRRHRLLKGIEGVCK